MALNLSAILDKLPQKGRTPILLATIGLTSFLIIAAMEGWFTRERVPEPPPSHTLDIQQRKGPLGNDLDKDLLIELRHETHTLKQRISEQQRLIDNLKELPSALEHYKNAPTYNITGTDTPDYTPQRPPLPPAANVSNTPYTAPQPRAVAMRTEWIGGTSIIKNPVKPAAPEATKVKERTIYLPSASFMRATLLNGVNAKTSLKGTQHPQIVTLRIDDLTILPNDLKANLKGCFALASAHGDLSDERVYLQLANLSCITHDGKGVIDQDIQGYVSDTDGQKGMAASVWAPFPDTLWRGMLISTLGGIGGFAADASNPMTSSFNGTSLFSERTEDPQIRDYLKGGIGSGIKDYTDRLNDFYFDLIDQQGPSVMVKPGARITVHFTKGVELKIRNVCGIGEEQTCES